MKLQCIVLLQSMHLFQEEIGAEMAHQLYVLQTLLFNLLEQRMNTKMDPQVFQVLYLSIFINNDNF